MASDQCKASASLPRRNDRSEEHTSELQSRQYLYSFPTRRSSDLFAAYPFALDQAGMPKDKHKKILHRDRVYVDGDIYTNSVESAFSLLKRGIMGTWHRISAKHLQAYLDEMTWRFDNRKNPFLFRDTMLKLIASDNLEYKELTAAA